MEPGGKKRTSMEILCPLRAGNSALLAFQAVKVVVLGGPDLTSVRMLVNVKKLPSTVVTFAGTIKSERISGSPAIAIWMMENEKTNSEKNVMEKILEAMEVYLI